MKRKITRGIIKVVFSHSYLKPVRQTADEHPALSALGRVLPVSERRHRSIQRYRRTRTHNLHYIYQYTSLRLISSMVVQNA